MKKDIIDITGTKTGNITLEKQIWGIEPNNSVLYDAITLAQNSQRQGTSSTKTRSEVSGGGRKPWSQKGTGRARQGSIRAPHWPGGGIVFGPHPRSYSKKMNKKERRLALKSALAYKQKEKAMIILNNLNIESNKTKDMLNLLKTIKAEKKVLIVTNELNDNLILATRNIKNVILLSAKEINTLDIVAADTLVITEDAIKTIEEVLV